MKYGEIIKLIEAGYSRDEIIAMQEDPKEEPKEDPKDEPKEDPEEDFSGVMEEMKSIFSDFKNELQAMNIMYSQQKHKAEATPEELIATIINPFDHGDK